MSKVGGSGVYGRPHRENRHEKNSRDEQTVNRADAGCCGRLLLRQRGKKVLDEGNNAVGSWREAQVTRWFGWSSQKTEGICLCSYN